MIGNYSYPIIVGGFGCQDRLFARLDIIPEQMIIDKFSSIDLYSLISGLYQQPNIFEYAGTMDSKKIVTQKKLIVAFIGIFAISFLTGFTPSLDTQACLPNYIQIEFCECDEEDIKGDNPQNSFLIKSVYANSIGPIKNAITIRELFQTRKFWLSSYSPRPPPQFKNPIAVFHIILFNFYTIPIVFLK